MLETDERLSKIYVNNVRSANWDLIIDWAKDCIEDHKVLKFECTFKA